MPFLTRTDEVFTLYLGDEGVELSEANPENRFSPEWMEAVHALLDRAEAEAGTDGNAALVVTATGKFFSNGLDVMHVMSHPAQLSAYLNRVHGVFARLLAFPMPTVAAVNGHAFGAGAMLLRSCDFAVMRSDRGFFCLPEVGLGLGFPLGMATLLRTRFPYQTVVEAATTGRRYGGDDALAAGIVDAAVAEAELMPTAIARAKASAALKGGAIGKVKRDLHAPLLAALATPVPADVTFG